VADPRALGTSSAISGGWIRKFARRGAPADAVGALLSLRGQTRFLAIHWRCWERRQSSNNPRTMQAYPHRGDCSTPTWPTLTIPKGPFMSQPPMPPGPPTQPWPQQEMPPGGQQPPYGPVPGKEPEGVRVAETEQRFVLHARSRNIARIIGYPAGLGLLAAAVFFPFGDTQDRLVVGIICGLFGLITLVWTWSMDRRRRIEVTEQQVTVVNSFSRYVVAWHELSDIEFEEIQAQGGWTAYHRLAFITPNKRIVAEAPAGSERELMKVRDRILHARELSLNEPQSDVGIAVVGPAAATDRAKRFGWPTLIITAVVALGLGGIIGGMIGGSGDGIATTAEPNPTVTVSETVTETAEAKPAPTASKSPTTKNTTEPKPKSTISDGIHEVGLDVKAGQYKTSVPEGEICYWERRIGDAISDSTSRYKEGPARLSVTLKKGEVFETEDCGTWTMV
jgi:hypothetical protein